MSFSNPMPISPVKKDIEFRKGEFSYWDSDKEERVSIPVPLKFVVLDTKSCIRGYCDTHGTVRSNEVANTKKELMVVNHWRKSKSGKSIKNHIATGVYKDIKDKVTSKSNGGHFCSVLYIMLPDGEICRYYVEGSGLSAWIEKKFDPVQEQCGIEVKSFGEGDIDGKVYKIPKFEKWHLTPATISMAVKCDQQLQNFFLDYAEWKGKEKEEEDVDPARDDEGFEEVNQELQETYEQTDEVPF